MSRYQTSAVAGAIDSIVCYGLLTRAVGPIVRAA